MSNTKNPVIQQNAWFDTKKSQFDTKMLGLTQKCHTQHASVGIAIIEHPHPYLPPLLTGNVFPTWFKRFVLTNPYINPTEISSVETVQQQSLAAKVQQCTQQEIS